LHSRPVSDEWALWARGLWRAAAACFVVAMLLGAFSYLEPGNISSSTSDLSDEFVNTMLADVNQETEL
jgi:hypothetical protein